MGSGGGGNFATFFVLEGVQAIFSIIQKSRKANARINTGKSLKDLDYDNIYTYIIA